MAIRIDDEEFSEIPADRKEKRESTFFFHQVRLGIRRFCLAAGEMMDMTGGLRAGPCARYRRVLLPRSQASQLGFHSGKPESDGHGLPP